MLVGEDALGSTMKDIAEGQNIFIKLSICFWIKTDAFSVSKPGISVMGSKTKLHFINCVLNFSSNAIRNKNHYR